METKISYLTVQDVLWLNLQLTRRVQAFQFDQLEDATYFQYGYGPSLDLVSQAARFLEAFEAKSPFPQGNAATGFLAFLVFMDTNGRPFSIPDAEALPWFEQFQRSPGSRTSMVEGACPELSSGRHLPDVHTSAENAMALYQKTLADLVSRESLVSSR